MVNGTGIKIPANFFCDINCVSNSAFYQRVTVLLNNNNKVVFEGTGEGCSMQTLDKQDIISLEACNEEYMITAIFEYSTNGPNGDFNPTTGVFEETLRDIDESVTIEEIKIKDFMDKPNFDITFTITFISDSIPSKSQFENNVFTSKHTDGSELQLHCKTYYDILQGGDEHYINIIPEKREESSLISVGSTGWDLNKGICYDQDTPLGGYLHVVVRLNNCRHDGFQGAVLILHTVIGYWGGLPSGYKPCKWTGEMTNTHRRLTRVEN